MILNNIDIWSLYHNENVLNSRDNNIKVNETDYSMYKLDKNKLAKKKMNQ